MKAFEELTEDEILTEALRALPEYLADIRVSGVFSPESCLNRCFRRIRNLLPEPEEKGLHGPDPRVRKDMEADLVCAHFEPMLRERIDSVHRQFLREHAVRKLHATTAIAIIQSTFEKVGLQAEVSGQKYRAKAEVALPGGPTVRFYVRYKDLQKEGLADDLVKAVLDLKDAFLRLGPGAVIR